MRIGVISETHGDFDRTKNAVRVLASLAVEQVLHCGDIGSPAIVTLFSDWPTHFVFGNVDRDHDSLRKMIEACHQTCHGPMATLELAAVRIAIVHGDDTQRLAETIASGQWDLVCCGHTHLAKEERVGRTLVLNPGAVTRAARCSVAT